ncbi:MAG TPA: DUF5996 family protein [bacterium]|nr:DUF5996 family protein [bacterium]
MALDPWPDIPLTAWEDTCSTLHLWTQIVGKIRLAFTPWVNHSWHVVLYPTPRGLTTSPIPFGRESFQIDFDFLAHALVIAKSDGAVARLPLRPQTVAGFYAEVVQALEGMGIEAKIDRMPNELPDAILFDRDETHRSYDAEAAQKFFRALHSSHRVLSEFRSAFLGKVSPVHFFWGSFDLAVTRFSGRKAPLLTGSRPGLPDTVNREAYSHEVSSAGFWPGNGGLGYPAFYSYAYPEPKGFSEFHVEPKETVYDTNFSQFFLPYDAVRTAADPEATLLRFLESTYRAVADNAGWDRSALECPLGRPKVPRPVD